RLEIGNGVFEVVRSVRVSGDEQERLDSARMALIALSRMRQPREEDEGPRAPRVGRNLSLGQVGHVEHDRIRWRSLKSGLPRVQYLCREAPIPILNRALGHRSRSKVALRCNRSDPVLGEDLERGALVRGAE